MRLASVTLKLLSASLGASQPEFSPPLQNFTQKLNHNSNDNVTFQQRYQLDATHFKPGGPILFHQGEEQPVTPLSRHVFSDYAPKLGAILATLEHRYFGKSFPDGLSAITNITVEQYAPLTLDNILQDSVEFLHFIRKAIPGAQNSKVIHGSGSYGGSISTLARIRHPETFYGSIAMSPALASFGTGITLQENPYKYAASDWTANVYWDTNADAAVKIRDALKDLHQCVAANNCNTALPGLNLCTQPTSQQDWLSLENLLLGDYTLIAQYDLAFPLLLPANPLSLLINQTLRTHIPGEVLHLPRNIVNNVGATACADWSAIQPPSAPIPTGSLAFWWLFCTFFPVSESAASPDNSLAPPWMVDAPGFVCPFPDFAGPDLNDTNQEWMERFGFTDEALDQVTRLLITHGGSDRTAAIGMPRLTLTSDRNHSRVITALGVGHVEMSFSEAVAPRGLKTQLDLLRDTQLAYIQEWLGITAVGDGQ